MSDVVSYQEKAVVTGALGTPGIRRVDSDVSEGTALSQLISVVMDDVVRGRIVYNLPTTTRVYTK